MTALLLALGFSLGGAYATASRIRTPANMPLWYVGRDGEPSLALGLFDLVVLFALLSLVVWGLVEYPWWGVPLLSASALFASPVLLRFLPFVGLQLIGGTLLIASGIGVWFI